MKKILSRLFLAAFLLLAVGAQVGCSSDSPAPSAGDFPVMDQGVLKSVLAEKVGKPVIMTFWATWCPSCREELPRMEKLARERKGDVHVLAVSLDDDAGALVRYFKDGLPPMETYLADRNLGSELSIQYIPHLMVFDAKGNRVLSRTGGLPYEMLDKLVDKLQ